MKGKSFTIIVVTLLLLSTFGVLPTSMASSVSRPLNYGALSPSMPEVISRTSLQETGELEGIDGTPRYQNIIAVGAQPDTGNPWTIPVIDEYWGGWYHLEFECVLEGEMTMRGTLHTHGALQASLVRLVRDIMT
jgi:hypothetical protein